MSNMMFRCYKEDVSGLKSRRIAALYNPLRYGDLYIEYWLEARASSLTTVSSDIAVCEGSSFAVSRHCQSP